MLYQKTTANPDFSFYLRDEISLEGTLAGCDREHDIQQIALRQELQIITDKHCLISLLKMTFCMGKKTSLENKTQRRIVYLLSTFSQMFSKSKFLFCYNVFHCTSTICFLINAPLDMQNIDKGAFILYPICKAVSVSLSFRDCQNNTVKSR